MLETYTILHVNYTSVKWDGKKGQHWRNKWFEPSELGDYKFWSRYRSGDIVPNFKTIIHIENIKMSSI